MGFQGGDVKKIDIFSTLCAELSSFVGSHDVRTEMGDLRINWIVNDENDEFYNW